MLYQTVFRRGWATFGGAPVRSVLFDDIFQSPIAVGAQQHVAVAPVATDFDEELAGDVALKATL